MNSLELRTLIHTALNGKAGTQYGDILTVDPIPPVPGSPVQLRVAAPDPVGERRVHVVSVADEALELPDRNPAVKMALKAAQRLAEEAQKQRARVEAQGRNPEQSKGVTKADAEYNGALTVLAHVLAGAGADILIEELPSLELAEVYLGQWDKKRHVAAFKRAMQD
jgi:hypothetical protein